MVIIHDSRLLHEAINNLQKYGDCISFSTCTITYEAISGHPDIFFCPIEKNIIAAPNTPDIYLKALAKKEINVVIGITPIGREKHNSTCYNVVITDKFIIHNQKYTDSSILDRKGDRKFIHLNQAYTRCSLLPLKDNSFITSDKGIEKTLLAYNLNVCYVNPQGILLPGHQYGFIGGCMGIQDDKIFIIGSLEKHKEGNKIKAFLKKLDYQIIELYKGNLYDGGSLFFVE